MPTDRKNLKEGLAKPSAMPSIQRGKGVVLSTVDETPKVETPESEKAKTLSGVIAERHNNHNAKGPERASRGFLIRTDLVKAMKRVALDDDKKLYEVVEEAIEQYLEWKKT